jgi:prophage regulatory protein
MEKLINIHYVTAATGLSRSTIYRCIQSGTFPKPIKPTGSGRTAAARWPESVIKHWLEAQIGVASHVIEARTRLI